MDGVGVEDPSIWMGDVSTVPVSTRTQQKI